MNHIDRLNAITEEVITEEQIFKTILPNGTIEYTNSKNELHNINDEPSVVWANGSKFWYKNGKLHRNKDKPAIIIEPDGYQAWYINNKFVKSYGRWMIYESC